MSINLKPASKTIFQDFIAARGLKSSRQRDLILDVFLRPGMRLSADELFRILRSRQLAVGHTTVYRTLKLLVDAGIAREIKRDNGASLYECLPSGD